MFSKFYNWIGSIEMTIAKYSLVAMTALVLISAVARSLKNPMSWTIDMSTFLFAWCVFMGADAAMRKDMLVSIDLFVERLSPKMQHAIKIFNYVIIAIFLIIFIFFGVTLSVSTYFRSFAGLPWLSYTWVTISVPLGCGLMLATTVLKIKELIKAGKEEKE